MAKLSPPSINVVGLPLLSSFTRSSLATSFVISLLLSWGSLDTYIGRGNRMLINQEDDNPGVFFFLSCRSYPSTEMFSNKLSRRLLTESNPTLLAEIINEGGQRRLVPHVNESHGAKIDYETDPEVKHILFSIHNATCQDRGSYTCESEITGISTRYYPWRNIFFITNVSITVFPGKVTITASPLKNVYKISEILTLTCKGNIGTEDPMVEQSWVWEYRNDSSIVWEFFKDAKSTKGPIVPNPNDPCRRSQEIKLTLQLTRHDNYRTYRCIARRSDQLGFMFLFDRQAAGYLIQDVIDPRVKPEAVDSVFHVRVPANTDVYIVYFSVFGIIAAINVISFLLHAMYKKKKKDMEIDEEIEEVEEEDD